MSKGANHWNWWTFIGACQGGHMEIVNLMISKGANDWNWGLHMCMPKEVHMEIINLMISKGASTYGINLSPRRKS